MAAWKDAAKELIESVKEKRPTAKELLRDWVRKTKKFTIGEAQQAYIGLGGHDKKRDGYDVYHKFSDIVNTSGSGPHGGKFSFTITCTYIGEEAEKKAEERYKAKVNHPCDSLWDRMPRNS